ncbi:MAG: hypothetical protein ACK4KV_03155 [Rhodocyclaceae bacterium]
MIKQVDVTKGEAGVLNGKQWHKCAWQGFGKNSILPGCYHNGRKRVLRRNIPDRTINENTRMEAILSKFGEAGEDDIQLWIRLIDKLRPSRATRTDEARDKLRALTTLINRREDLRERLRDSLFRLFDSRKVVSLYVSSGLLPSTPGGHPKSPSDGHFKIPQLLTVGGQAR